jgi:hypothetical protein
MKTEFNKGDIVRCIDNRGKENFLTVNKLYKIKTVKSSEFFDLFTLDELGRVTSFDQKFNATRFEAINKKEKPEMKPTKTTNKKRTSTYQFIASSPDAFDPAKVSELSEECPLAIVHRDDGYHRIVLHKSLVRKAKLSLQGRFDLECLKQEYMYGKKLDQWKKTEDGNISFTVQTVREMSQCSFDNRCDTKFTVDIVKI